MTNIESITSLARRAYTAHYNFTSELPESDALTPDEVDIIAIDKIHNDTYMIRIADDCDIALLALELDHTTDAFATNESSIRFFISADECPYIMIPTSLYE